MRFNDVMLIYIIAPVAALFPHLCVDIRDYWESFDTKLYPTRPSLRDRRGNQGKGHGYFLEK